MKTTAKRESRSAVADDYLELIRRFPLRPIRTKAEHALAVATLLPLAGKATTRPRSLTSGEEDYYLVLSELVSKYELPTRDALLTQTSPLSRLEHLMDAAGMKAKDLAELLGTRSGTSMILNGKRPISRSQAKVIAAQFGVDAGLFL